MCTYVCVCQTITFESLGKFIFAHAHLPRIRVKVIIEVIGSRSQSQERKSRKSSFLQCKNSIAHNSGSVKDRAMMFACIDREFEFYEFFSFLKFSEFYEFFFGWKKNRKKFVILQIIDV